MTKLIRFLSAVTTLAALLVVMLMPAQARTLAADVGDLIASSIQGTSYASPATGEVEIAFSPNEGAEELVLKTIRSARSQVRMLAYSLTSVSVTRALVDARKRGVDVKVVADYKSNLVEDRSGAGRSALGALANAGVDIRIIRAYPIHHDKMIVVDRNSVETGSYNYSSSAAKRNSENAVVLWNNPQAAKAYLAHFERNFRQSEVYHPRY